MSNGRLWTEEEIKYLKDNYCNMPVFALARRLNRTDNAVKIKLKGLNLQGYTLSNCRYLTMHQVYHILHISNKTLTKWINTYEDFPIYKKRLFKGHVIHKYIDLDELLQWLEKHQDLINANKIEKYALGIEPEWLVKKRKEDYKKLAINKSKRYTSDEFNTIINLHKIGKSNSEIAKRLNRSPSAIKKIIFRLKQSNKL